MLTNTIGYPISKTELNLGTKDTFSRSFSAFDLNLDGEFANSRLILAENTWNDASTKIRTLKFSPTKIEMFLITETIYVDRSTLKTK